MVWILSAVVIFTIGYLIGKAKSHYDGEFTADPKHPENCNLVLHKEIKDVSEMKRLNLKVIGVKKDETTKK